MVTARDRQRIRTDSRNINRTAVPSQTVMKTGLSTFRGQVNEEYLTQLKPWSKEIKIFTEMQDDVVIGALFESIKTPLMSSPFEIAAGGNSPEDIEAKEFLQANLLENPNFEWVTHVEEMLQFIDIGFALSEKVLEPNKIDGLLHLRDLMPIGQDSLDRWGEPDDFGRVTSFQQRDKLGAIRSAPMDKLCHFTFRGRKRNPQGQGILRALYRPWYFKKNLETLEAIGVERDVGNAPVVELKEGVRYKQSDLDALAAALEGFRMDEMVYVIMPGGAKLTAYGGGNKVYDVRVIISAWQHLIRQRFFADFLAFGSTNVGTQALAREMTTFFGLALRSIQNMMRSVWNRQLVPWLFEWNHWHLKKFPTVEWLRPGESNIQSLVQAYQMLVNSGLMDVNDPEFRARVRSQIGLKPFIGEEKKVIQPFKTSGQLQQQKVVGQIKAEELVIELDQDELISAIAELVDPVNLEILQRPNFNEFQGSELVDVMIEFIDSILRSVIGGTQDAERGIREISDLHSDVLRMEQSNKITSEERLQVGKKVSEGTNTLNRIRF